MFVSNLDKEIESSKQKRTDKEVKTKESASTGEAKEVKNKEQDGNSPNGSTSEGKNDMNDKKLDKKDDSGDSETGKNEEKKEQVEAAEIQTPGSAKSGKKKIVRRVVKQKVVGKSASDSTTKEPDNVAEKNNTEGEKENPEAPGEDDSSPDPAGVKTFKRKRIVKKVSVAKAAQNEDNTNTEVKVGQETGCSEEKAEPSSGPAVQDTNAKTVVKKKIIKKVAKRKVAGAELSKGIDVDQKNVIGNETESTQKITAVVEKPAAKGSKTEVPDKQKDVVSSTKADSKDVKEDKKDEKRAGDKSGSVTKAERSKSKDAEKSKDEKEKRDGKDESRAKLTREVKETRKPEEPPRHPGFILQTKLSKDSKVG